MTLMMLEIKQFKFLPLAVLVGALFTSRCAQAASALDIDGEYVQAGDCKCEQYQPGEACHDTQNKAAIAAFFHSPMKLGGATWSTWTGDTITDANGNKRSVSMWLYDRRPAQGEFRYRETDQLSYSIKSLGSDRVFEVTVRNLTLEQEPVVIHLEAPADQAGGEVNGPATEKTVVDASTLEHSHYSVQWENRVSAGPMALAPGAKQLYDFFRLKRLDNDRLVVTTGFDYKWASYGKGKPDTFNYSFLSCPLVRK